MNTIKKFAGIVWVLLGPAGMWYLFSLASADIAKKPVIDTKIQWIVFIGIFIPIAIGLVIFGYYCLTGEYSNKQDNS